MANYIFFGTRKSIRMMEETDKPIVEQMMGKEANDANDLKIVVDNKTTKVIAVVVAEGDTLTAFTETAKISITEGNPEISRILDILD